MTDKTAFIRDNVQELENQGLYNTIRTIEGPQGAHLMVNGREVLNFCSNNYLGLANDPRMVSAATAALARYGVGPGAVRTIAGTMTIHTELEGALARFKGVEATISLQSGFAANLAVIPALVGAGDVIISDELNHASIVDGVRLAKAARKIYAHSDVAMLAERLAEARSEGANRILVITDGVFSMDGDLAPLDRIVDAADAFDAMVMVDDAHGEGVVGRGGRGIVDHFGSPRPGRRRGRHDVEGFRRGGRLRCRIDRTDRVAPSARPPVPLLLCRYTARRRGLPRCRGDTRRFDRTRRSPLGECRRVQGDDDGVWLRHRLERDADHAGHARR